MSKRWYVVHAYSGFEKSVMRAIQERIDRLGMQEKFGRILVPVVWHIAHRLRASPRRRDLLLARPAQRVIS